MKLPNYVLITLNDLKEAGYKAYVVGGAVRDYYLGINPYDYDIATSATPNQIKEVFKNYNLIETGIKHGTIGVIISKRVIEITTFRKEEEYLDFRRPKQVKFIDNLEEDLARRDFTINALAYDTELIDYYEGINDLEEGIIRTIGKAEDRFKEDPLRILRALRFRATFNFKIEEETKKAIFLYFPLLEKVANERIYQELNKIINTKYAYLAFIEYKGLLEEVIFKFEIPKINLNSLKYTDLEEDYRQASIFLGVNSSLLKKYLNKYKYSNKLKKTILEFNQAYDRDYIPSEVNLLKHLKQVDYKIILNILYLKKLHLSLDNKDIKIVDETILKLKGLRKSIITVKSLKVNGNDLLALGYREGRMIRNTLEVLVDECIEGKLENSHNELISRAKEILEKDYLFSE